MTSAKPQITDNGIAFTVRVDCINRECIVSNDALSKLSQLAPKAGDLMQTFLAYEANINGVARRMVNAGVQGSPLQVGAQNFKL